MGAECRRCAKLTLSDQATRPDRPTPGVFRWTARHYYTTTKGGQREDQALHADDDAGTEGRGWRGPVGEIARRRCSTAVCAADARGPRAAAAGMKAGKARTLVGGAIGGCEAQWGRQSAGNRVHLVPQPVARLILRWRGAPKRAAHLCPRIRNGPQNASRCCVTEWIELLNHSRQGWERGAQSCAPHGARAARACGHSAGPGDCAPARRAQQADWAKAAEKRCFFKIVVLI